ncbi:MAG TPA: hypothetical protein VIW23_14610 [Candidatus Acidoferrum sp.]|jgi:hypothetical protein
MPAGPKSRFAHLPGIFARAALLLVPVILLASFVTVRTIRHTAAEKDKASHSSISANSPDSLDLSPVSLEPRPVFPYSIVPGGVRNAAELQAAAKADAVVAKHYADFGIAQARPIHLDRPLAMFVSYRRDNQVFWTKNRMVIPAGETLISDGENLARVRCGNRLSPIAVKPVAASEPTTEELNEPKFIPPLLAQMLPGDGGEFFPVPPANALPPGPPGSNVAPPPVFPPILVPGVPPLTPLSPVPPPVSTPEPAPLVLLAVGAAFIMLSATFTLRGHRTS